MTFDEFRASAAPCSDAVWAFLLDDSFAHPRESVRLYAGDFVIFEAGGLFWVMAWWYAPLSYATLAEAETALWPWYQEWF